MRVALVLTFCVAVFAATPQENERIVGGVNTTINRWPSMANVMVSLNGITFQQFCAGSILNRMSILSAAQCFGSSPSRYRVRLGSSYASSQGSVLIVANITNHPSYNYPVINDNDISILHLDSSIVYSNVIQPASLGSYQIGDNQVLWATGWGFTSNLGPPSEQLREVQIYTINQNICASRYALVGATVTGNMLCSGVLDVGGRGQCSQDYGGPVYHNGVVVGIVSWGAVCASPVFPGVNTRVSNYISWIASNA